MISTGNSLNATSCLGGGEGMFSCQPRNRNGTKNSKFISRPGTYRRKFHVYVNQEIKPNDSYAVYVVWKINTLQNIGIQSRFVLELDMKKVFYIKGFVFAC